MKSYGETAYFAYMYMNRSFISVAFISLSLYQHKIVEVDIHRADENYEYFEALLVMRLFGWWKYMIVRIHCNVWGFVRVYVFV